MYITYNPSFLLLGTDMLETYLPNGICAQGAGKRFSQQDCSSQQQKIRTTQMSISRKINNLVVVSKQVEN